MGIVFLCRPGAKLDFERLQLGAGCTQRVRTGNQELAIEALWGDRSRADGRPRRTLPVARFMGLVCRGVERRT